MIDTPPKPWWWPAFEGPRSRGDPALWDYGLTPEQIARSQVAGEIFLAWGVLSRQWSLGYRILNWRFLRHARTALRTSLKFVSEAT